MQKPVNPLRGTLSWLGYVVHRHKPLALSLSGLLVAFGTILSGIEIWWGVPPICAGVIIPALDLWWERRSENNNELTSAREKVLEEALAPLLELAATATFRPREKRIETAEAAAMRVAGDLRAAFASVPEVRAVVFVVSTDGLRMEPRFPAGRPDRPRDFVRGTERGDQAFRILDELPGRFIIVEDLRSEGADTPYWAGTGAHYNTFIAAPIRSTEHAFGMVTIDAPQPGSLDHQHGSTIALFAAALGILFAEAARGATGGPGPDKRNGRDGKDQVDQTPRELPRPEDGNARGEAPESP
ncbi:GAF domain-containing protein [Nocardiopsis sp. MG754419]|uniref:GAF domain-containing protein n=1 Tax=Nocardiopsis sp. MG754419 TaxID=2259865 RepID=UPI001BAAD226|nr:GAF domain-containing protein [Nocardiopsis sp. MG754419]